MRSAADGGWAFVEPSRKLYYNLAVTFLSGSFAIAIGVVEAAGLLHEKFGMAAPWPAMLAGSHNAMTEAGYGAIAGFAVVWLLSAIFHRVRPMAARVQNPRQIPLQVRTDFAHLGIHRTEP